MLCDEAAACISDGVIWAAEDPPPEDFGVPGFEEVFFVFADVDDTFDCVKIQEDM